MTVERDSGPGVSTYDSAKFSATVDGTTSKVYGHSRSTYMACDVWLRGDVVEISWLKFGCDTTVEVVVSLVGGAPITDVVFYPGDKGVTYEIVAGNAVFTIPTNTRIRVEINGDRAEVLNIFAEPLKSTEPSVGTRTAYTTLPKTVTVDAGTNELVFGAAHGFSTGNLLKLSTTGALPTVASGTVLNEWDRYRIIVTSTTRVQLEDAYNGYAVYDFTDTGSGTITACQTWWGNTSSTLYFGAGVHKMGRWFAPTTNVDIYLDYGAFVIGSFDLRGVDQVTIKGPGVLMGNYTNFEYIDTLAWADRVKFSSFYGDNGAKYNFDNLVQGISVVGHPYYFCYEGVWSFRNVQVINCWTWEADGFRFSAQDGVDQLAECVDCFAMTADDNCYYRPEYHNLTVTNLFGVCVANAAFHGYYFPSIIDLDYTSSVNDCDVVHLGLADLGPTVLDASTNYPAWLGNCVVRTLMDGASTDSLKGHFDQTFSTLKVWGPIKSRVIALANRIYPYALFAGQTQKEQYGQIADWTFSGVWTEQTPGQKSVIWGKNATNTPHDITLTGLQFGGVDIYDTNYEDFFDLNSFPYNINWETEPQLPEPDTFIVEDGTGKADAVSYISVADADAYFANHSNPAAWSAATVPQKQNALREATLALDLIWGNAWAGTKRTSAQALDWPRTNVTDPAGNPYSSTALPTRLLWATAQMALLHLSGETLLPSVETVAATISSETVTVGPISKSTSYQGGLSTGTVYPTVSKTLSTAGLTRGSGSGWGAAQL